MTLTIALFIIFGLLVLLGCALAADTDGGSAFIAIPGIFGLLYLLIACSLERPIGVVKEYPMAEIVSPNGTIKQGYWENDQFNEMRFGCVLPKNAIIKKYDCRGYRMGIYAESSWNYDYVIPNKKGN